MARILVADDDEGIRSFVAESLELAGHVATQVKDGLEALKSLERESFHVLVTDLRMPHMDGLALMREVARTHPDLQVVILTAYGTIERAVEAMRLGAFDFVVKPVESPEAIALIVQRALERRSLLALREASHQDGVPPISYGAPAMEPLLRSLNKVSPTQATVLLLGETGTGKEFVARAIHRNSPRRDGPFVAVNCAALSQNLLESELFGHEKGAFTGASEQRRGKIELADGGTFFLDEVGDMHPEVQARLLRVLQERSFERLGGRQTIEADVRWVAATNRDLLKMMEEGTFRADLYHRLAVFPLELPPLRERREDLVPLAETLLKRLGDAAGRPGLRLGADALALIETFDWSGNIRELANALERAVILADGREIGADDLLPATRRRSRSAEIDPFSSAQRASQSAEIDPAARPSLIRLGALEDIEREAIRQVLEAVGGHRRQAADHLGIALRTLYLKLQRYGLD